MISPLGIHDKRSFTHISQHHTNYPNELYKNQTEPVQKTGFEVGSYQKNRTIFAFLWSKVVECGEFCVTLEPKTL